jgi:hypothetical protein
MGTEEMIAIVQCYIKIRKDKDIDIIIRNERDLLLLIKAYNIASIWLKNNNVKINMI